MFIQLLPYLFQLDKVLIALLVLITGVFIYYKKRSRLLDYGLALILTSGISEMIKYFVNKPRPISDFIFEGSGFPSSHSATAACVVFFYLLICHNPPESLLGIGKAIRRNFLTVEGAKGILVIALGSMVAWLRIVLKAHDLTDVFAGITLGYIITLLFMFYDISGRRVK